MMNRGTHMSQEIQVFQVVCNLIAAAVSVTGAVIAYRARKQIENIRKNAQTPPTPNEPIEKCPDTQPSRV